MVNYGYLGEYIHTGSMCACQQILGTRYLYMFLLQRTLKKTDLWESDINVTDEDNFTLLMVAALHNRYITLCLDTLQSCWGID